MKQLWQIFYTFANIGAFTIGGGYAMLPLIQREIVERKKWIPAEEFIDLLAVSQALPGIWAVNIALMTGYRLQGNKGSIVAVTGAILPSFVIILLIAAFFRNFQENIYVAKMFKAIRPVVVALIAVPVFTTARSAGINLKTAIIPVASAFLIWYWGVSPVWIVLAAALGGLVWGWLWKK
ncbi:chromate transporter [Bacteroidia bacterium]|nr:chromate transporter [Bacteroidia bacterium]GHU71499.1 chromate transporter [Bacteroidia bacterium]